MLYPVPTVVFVKRSAVKLVKAEFVLREMCGYPIQNHAYSVSMKLVYEIHKVFRRTEPRSNRVIPRYLIAPRTVERIFRNGHKFNVIITFGFNVFNEASREFAIRIIVAVFFAFERQQIDLVNIHRLIMSAEPIARRGKVLVAPLKPVYIVHLGRVCGRSFGMVSVGIGFKHGFSVCFYRVLIIIVLLYPLNEQFENAAVEFFHRIEFFVPSVEISHERNAVRRRRPYTENSAAFSVPFYQMRA